ncbi:MAG: DUF2961 domain-containing protein [Planctomycetia bacterium]|jgi:hypothetical protein
MKTLLISTAIALFAIGTYAEGAEMVSVATELQRMRSADHLYRPQDYRLVQYSGFSRKGGNPDRMDCLYKEDGWRVVADHKGPGVVSRIWTTHGDQWSDIQIEVDGKVLFTGNAREFFGQDKFPFVKPLTEVRKRVSDQATIEGEGTGKREWGVSYVPIPFEKRFRYLQREKVYSNINIKSFDAGRKVESFNDADWNSLKKEVDRTAAVWRDMSLHGKPLTQCEGMIVIPAATKDAPATGEAIKLTGPGIIRGIRVQTAKPEQSRDVDLQIYWDDEKKPGIDSPLDQGFGSRERRTLAIGQSDDGWRFCSFPMPFRKQATIRLVSRLPKKVRCELELLVEEDVSLPKDVLYLRSYQNKGEFKAGAPFEKPGLPLADFFYENGYTAFEHQGAGHIVAYMDLFDCQPELDEHIFIDGERKFPQNRWNGTGHEDLFDMAWGHSPISAPMTSGGSEKFEEVNVKLFWNDPMTFQKSIRFNWEWAFVFGKKAPRDARFASVVYWYGKP